MASEQEAVEQAAGGGGPLAKYISEPDLAAWFGVSRAVIRGLRAKGMPVVKIGMKSWYHEDEVDLFLRGRCTKRAIAQESPSIEGK